MACLRGRERTKSPLLCLGNGKLFAWLSHDVEPHSEINWWTSLLYYKTIVFDCIMVIKLLFFFFFFKSFQSDYAFLREREVRGWVEKQRKKALHNPWMRCFHVQLEGDKGMI